MYATKCLSEAISTTDQLLVFFDILIGKGTKNNNQDGEGQAEIRRNGVGDAGGSIRKVFKYTPTDPDPGSKNSGGSQLHLQRPVTEQKNIGQKQNPGYCKGSNNYRVVKDIETAIREKVAVRKFYLTVRHVGTKQAEAGTGSQQEENGL